MRETWKDIKCFDGLYQVSSKGRIKRVYNGRETLINTTIDDLVSPKPVIQQFDGDSLVYTYDEDTLPDEFDIKAVLRCCEGKQKTHKGFSWEYEV